LTNSVTSRASLLSGTARPATDLELGSLVFDRTNAITYSSKIYSGRSEPSLKPNRSGSSCSVSEPPTQQYGDDIPDPSGGKINLENFRSLKQYDFFRFY
jgi:hypothetical protein